MLVIIIMIKNNFFILKFLLKRNIFIKKVFIVLVLVKIVYIVFVVRCLYVLERKWKLIVIIFKIII